MPMAMLVPDRFRGGNPQVPVVDEPTLNIDVVPTIVDLAGAPTCIAVDQCRVMDGRSLTGLLADDARDWPAERPLLQELQLNVDSVLAGRGTSCRFVGVRQGPWLYVEHTRVPDPELGVCEDRTVIEAYDTKGDPYELTNLAAPGEETQAFEEAAPRLSEMVAELENCSGIEGRDPEPESGHYCS
jgi:arylsulfatase A-like enzyme